MTHTPAKILSVIVSTLAIIGCASTSEPTRMSGDLSEQVWDAGMPAPITQRYPVLEFNQVGSARPVSLAPEEYFQCSEEDVSTLTDDIPPLDVSFIEADILDALLELSLLTGISIITDDSIEGIVSINFTNSTLEDVIAAIIAPGNFGFKVFDTFIYVGSQNPLSPSFHLLSQSCMYKPAFLHPQQVIEMLTPFYQQYVNYHDGHDYLSIVAPEGIQKRIQKDIRVFDQAPRQILLEMSIVEVSEEALDMLGVKWNREVSTAGLLRQNTSSTGSLFTYSDARDSASPVAQALIDSVSALNTGEEVQIRAMPSMVTLNGREANFASTQTSWLAALNSGSGSQRMAVSYGVDLKIVPYISQDNQVRLEIMQASVSDLTQDFNNDPKLISHAISTSVLMQDGETLVLGGLLQKKNRNNKSNVPGASKTPLIGGLFKHSEEEAVNTEVLIVIRPQILNG